ncbi:hypothetical protein PILCRDRAFT_11730 [Piloderma croceum F 1598]|uniref:Uncharacterized protein n=1 Tax=Piloderma croceum (strain F 1598) TaxID=765440 RepID=A0A0C3EZ69_PILCF|nr:hypothetical protein PILCRDRAFT_11730 [Piloderma croceum F 1598]
MTEPSLGLRPFFASEMARLSAGCASDGLGISTSQQGFHSAWHRDSQSRKLTRSNGFHLVADIIEALDRTTALGSVTFHIHGECAPGASLGNNITVHASTMLLNNPGASDGLAHMAEIFRDDVAGAYREDWLLRAVNENYLPAQAMSPPSSPVKGAGVVAQQHFASLARAPKVRMECPPSTSSSISTASSLTESALAYHTHDSSPPTPRAKSRRTHTSAQPPSHAALPATLHKTPIKVQTTSLLPSSLTLSSTVTLSSPVVSGTISGVTGSSLPNVVEDFMKDIGKGGTDDHEIVRDIYLFTGRALWESSIMERVGLSLGSAKALVGLMSSIT